jgi:hypothetical protein
MISGTHVIPYSKDAEADRAFFRDVLAFKSVDAGHGWLIFSLPQRKRHSIRRTRAIAANDGVP